MTNVSSTRAPQSTPRPAPREPQARPANAPEDAKALSDAFAKARDKLDRFTARQGDGKPARPGVKQEELARPQQQQQQPVRHRADERETSRRPVASDRAADGQGASAAAPAAPPPLAMPAMPAAHVDPSGFAQMLADLWTRENGKGAKEIRVRFGESAWPATGAELVRNAAGTLDIALNVAGTDTSYGRQLEGLDRHLRDAGLGVGVLKITDDRDLA